MGAGAHQNRAGPDEEAHKRWGDDRGEQGGDVPGPEPYEEHVPGSPLDIGLEIGCKAHLSFRSDRKRNGYLKTNARKTLISEATKSANALTFGACCMSLCISR